MRHPKTSKKRRIPPSDGFALEAKIEEEKRKWDIPSFLIKEGGPSTISPNIIQTPFPE